MFVGLTTIVGHFIEHLDGLGDHTGGGEAPDKANEEVGGEEVRGLTADLIDESPGGAEMTHLGEDADHGAAGGGGRGMVGAAGGPGEEAEGEGAGVAAAADDALEEARAEGDAAVAKGEVELGRARVELAEDAVDPLDVGGELVSGGGGDGTARSMAEGRSSYGDGGGEGSEDDQSSPTAIGGDLVHCFVPPRHATPRHARREAHSKCP